MTTRLQQAQRGAALLIAMLILTLVATVASAMVWHQQRAIEVEAAERARAQATLLLTGAVDWVRWVIPTDVNKAFPANAAGAYKLNETNLSSFLAADRDNNSDGGLDVVLSGEIGDAQSRYNLRRLIGDDGKPVVLEVAGLRRLCDAAGVSADVSDRLVQGLMAAWYGKTDSAPLPPTRVEQLVWLGIDADTVARLAPYVTLLPSRTALNANTAQAPALLAAIDKLDLANAQRIVQSLQRAPAQSVPALQELLPANVTLEEGRVGVSTRHFDVLGRVTFEDRALEVRWLVERRTSERDLVVLRREQRVRLGQTS